MTFSIFVMSACLQLSMMVVKWMMWNIWFMFVFVLDMPEKIWLLSVKNQGKDEVKVIDAKQVN